MSGFLSRGIVLPDIPKLASDYAVGDVVLIPYNGVDTEFIVVHQGNPDSGIYDSSCDGTWLMMKQTIGTIDMERRGWKNTAAINYLETDFYIALADSVQRSLVDVLLPYVEASSDETKYGADGHPCNIFLLSGREVGFTTASSIPANEGKLLDYFTTDAANRRIATRNGGSTAYEWWLRSPTLGSTTTQRSVSASGGSTTGNVDDDEECDIRPTFILNEDTQFSSRTNAILQNSQFPTRLHLHFKGTGDGTNCYATLSGVKYTSALGAMKIVPGSEIVFGVYGSATSGTFQGWVRIDGVEVLTASDKTVHEYRWTVPTGKKLISVSFSGTNALSLKYGHITVTTY